MYEKSQLQLVIGHRHQQLSTMSLTEGERSSEIDSLSQSDSSSDINGPSASNYSAEYHISCAFTRREEHSSITFAQIESSSNSCRICCLYRDIILAVVGGYLPAVFKGSRDEAEIKLILERLTISNGWDDSCFETDQLAFNIMEDHVTLALFIDEDAEVVSDFSIQGRHFPQASRIGRRTNSRASFERAQKWLLECLTSHACPRPASTGIPLPKRLLDVQGSAHDPIRLTETQEKEHPYVSLSYRWGSSAHKQLKSTVRTIQDHMAQIKWDDLPATFQDAVTVCRSMGVRYLWIDSLCILQEFKGIESAELEATKRDFAKENSVMARTYQNSHFTISADLSTHMDSGLFSPVPVDDHPIAVIDDDGSSASLYIRRCVDHYGKEKIDLETRGWTFQEFLLPPRVLHFGEFDIEWRCKTRLTCECGALDCEAQGQAPWHRHHFIHEAAKPVSEDPEDALRWWETVVHSYTSRELTSPSDKLPALSGLAQLRKHARGGVYLAGLWQDSLVHDLCWYHTRDYNSAKTGGVGHRPAEYRAPSWSWASVDTDSGCSFWWTGAILIHPISPWAEPRQACTILESFCQPKTADPTGEVRSGFLDIQVALIPAEVCHDPEQEVAWTIINIETDLALEFFKPDCELEDDSLAIGGRVYCAPIAETVLETGVERGCLVLRKLYTSIYQRVGFCILRKGQSPASPWLSWGLSQDDDQPRKLDPEEYTLPGITEARITII